MNIEKKNFFIILLLASLTACCVWKKTSDPKSELTPDTLPAEKAKSTSKILLLQSQEFIFSSEVEISEKKLAEAFSKDDLLTVKSLGSRQFLLKFSSAKSESEVSEVLQKNRLIGTLGKNLRYRLDGPKVPQR